MKVLVIGLGKLGLPLATVIASSGYMVLGYDKSISLVNSLNSNDFKSSEPELLNLLEKNRSKLSFTASVCKEVLDDIDLIFVVVPTPSLPSGEFSNEYILSTISEIGPYLRVKNSKTVICVVSTVMPGSCDGEIKTQLESVIGEPLGRKVGLCYHPEFIALGSVIKNLYFPDYQLLGVSDGWVAEMVERVFKTITKSKVPLKIMNLLEAEIVKISVNNYITMKISFANSIYQLSDSFDNVNIQTITQAIGMDSRIGNSYLSAGAPYGGPCFPRDTRAMAKLFSDMSITNTYPELTSRYNRDYTNFLVSKILGLTSEKDAIGVLGISYKIGTPVIDDSPGVVIAKALLKKDRKIFSWDDENAKIPDEGITDLSLDKILRVCDFFIITRKSSKQREINDYLVANDKKFIDLWNL